MSEKTAPKSDKPEEPFDWMKFLKLHPLVVAGSLIVSGAAGGVAGYLAFGSFIKTKASEALDAKLDEIREHLNAFPQNAIVAFDGECPDPWIDIGRFDDEKFAGRIMVVAGPQVKRNEGQSTTKRAHGESGGSESVTLSSRNMPSDFHVQTGGVKSSETFALSYSGEFEAFKQGDGKMLFKADHTHEFPQNGKDEAHENMPPFIALTFCRKK